MGVKRTAAMRLDSGLLQCQVEVMVALLFWCIYGVVQNKLYA